MPPQNKQIAHNFVKKKKEKKTEKETKLSHITVTNGVDSDETKLAHKTERRHFHITIQYIVLVVQQYSCRSASRVSKDTNGDGGLVLIPPQSASFLKI